MNRNVEIKGEKKISQLRFHHMYVYVRVGLQQLIRPVPPATSCRGHFAVSARARRVLVNISWDNYRPPPRASRRPGPRADG
ncbi:hypothetical protein EVAR_97452_1 [Eumeta japonica]|uniref:Uncharacterized protein n=1 Tax=Eumeta variegata TaxID=151549 RepID=A0A4C1WXD7_EUMVA|nr:hypothetical protein EVAR_97452_1 [Eumeta japonica]